jgi:hypothetical protein
LLLFLKNKLAKRTGYLVGWTLKATVGIVDYAFRVQLRFWFAAAGIAMVGPPSIVKLKRNGCFHG